jgi:hypothetical protein
MILVSHELGCQPLHAWFLDRAAGEAVFSDSEGSIPEARQKTKKTALRAERKGKKNTTG